MGNSESSICFWNSKFHRNSEFLEIWTIGPIVIDRTHAYCILWLHCSDCADFDHRFTLKWIIDLANSKWFCIANIKYISCIVPWKSHVAQIIQYFDPAHSMLLREPLQARIFKSIDAPTNLCPHLRISVSETQTYIILIARAMIHFSTNRAWIAIFILLIDSSWKESLALRMAKRQCSRRIDDLKTGKRIFKESHCISMTPASRSALHLQKHHDSEKSPGLNIAKDFKDR